MKRNVFVLSLTLLFAALPMFAAFDAFLKIDSIPGESSAPGHQGWIEIESWSWGATSGAGAGKCTVHDFHFMHKVDRSSPALAQAALTGLLLPAVTVEAGGERHLLQNVMVKSVQNVNGNSGPAQAIALSFAKCATHETGQGPLPAKKATLEGLTVKGYTVKAESPNGMLGLGGGSGDPVALQDLHFNGPNQAVIAIRKAGEGTQGILIALLRASQTKSHIPQVTLKAKKAGGAQQQYYEIKMEDVLVSSYQTGGGGAGFDQITLDFATLTGPMTGFHDVDIK